MFEDSIGEIPCPDCGGSGESDPTRQDETFQMFVGTLKEWGDK